MRSVRVFALPPKAGIEQNIEAMMGVNCVAHLLLTLLLLPQLRASTTAARVICTSSIGADDAPPNGTEFEMLDNGTTNRIRKYKASKAGDWILEREFARR
ncbi:hypothetical protein ZTR_01978 [Talaromyces verruculosus]|nr:hypothetical protein ZTR_01978 [Talaromyces verruculosus]